MQSDDKQHRSILQKIAHRAMLQRGLLPDFSSAALSELGRLGECDYSMRNLKLERRTSHATLKDT